MTSTPDKIQQQLLDVAEIAVTLNQRLTPKGVVRWLTERGVSDDRRGETPLDLIQTGEIEIVKRAAEKAVQ